MKSWPNFLGGAKIQKTKNKKKTFGKVKARGCGDLIGFRAVLVSGPPKMAPLIYPLKSCDRFGLENDWTSSCWPPSGAFLLTSSCCIDLEHQICLRTLCKKMKQIKIGLRSNPQNNICLTSADTKWKQPFGIRIWVLGPLCMQSRCSAVFGVGVPSTDAMIIDLWSSQFLHIRGRVKTS